MSGAMQTRLFDTSSKVYRGTVDPADVNSAWSRIVARVPPGSRVLEIGCAEGYMSAYLRQAKGCAVTGVDLSAEAAAAAAAYCERVVVGDVEAGALDQVGGPFDVVICADVLEHLRHPGRVLRELRARLADGGLALVSLPNVAHWDVRRPLLAGRFDYASSGLLDDTHLRFFTRETARALIEQSGFRVRETDFVHRWPRQWKYGRLYRRFERPLRRLTARYFLGLFGYQFIFVAVPFGGGARGH
jgi:methionine biosynthesis protein MetW